MYSEYTNLIQQKLSISALRKDDGMEMEKCPHCFGEKPVEAKVCLHCGRDKEGFGPTVRSETVAIAQNAANTAQLVRIKKKYHQMLSALTVIASIFVFGVIPSVGAFLFFGGLFWFIIARICDC